MGKSEEPEIRGQGFDRDQQSFYTEGKSYFLGIGIDEYQHLRKLHNAVADVKRVAELLFEEFIFEEPEVLENEGATAQAITNSLASSTRKLKSMDKLVIYFSGHSIKDRVNPEHEAVFWAPVDATLNNRHSLISGDQIKSLFKSSIAKHILLISDSCFSGGFFSDRGGIDKERIEENWARELEKRDSRWAVFSGRDMETVSDGIPGKHSPFATAIIDFFQSEKKSSFVNVGYFVNQVSVLASRYTEKQTAYGEPIPDCGHISSGQYVFWRRKIKKKWPQIPRISQSKNPSTTPLPKYPIDFSELPPIPLITLKMLIAMEESLRKSCQLMLKQLNIPVNQNTWVLRSVCESKIHALVDLLKGMDTFQKMFVKHSLDSSKLYHSLKKIRQDYLDNFEESELEFMRSIGSSDFIAVIQTPSSNIGFQLSACEKVLKEVVAENGTDRDDLDYRLTEIKVALKLLYILFENIHQATDLYDIPPHLSN